MCEWVERRKERRGAGEDEWTRNAECFVDERNWRKERTKVARTKKERSYCKGERT